MVGLLSKKWLAVYGAGMALVLVMAVLVGAYYRSQTALRESHLESFRQELILRSTTVSFFYNELSGDLRQMAGSKRVESYFGSKALGMSMRYGLGASLAQVGRMFKSETYGKLLGSEPVWLRLALVAPSGKLLVESRSLELSDTRAERLVLPPLDQLGNRPVILSAGRGRPGGHGVGLFL